LQSISQGNPITPLEAASGSYLNWKILAALMTPNVEGQGTLRAFIAQRPRGLPAWAC
jgi:hypothetical protein